jgi:putative Mg2+ transporter-C (MgtC) family protein
MKEIARWLVESWLLLLQPPWCQIALPLVSAVCGGIVGAERERREKPAGLRTLILVCLGSTVFTMVSFVFTANNGDSGRVAAQIVTGIGFLGAGVILHGRGNISGTTTAATIWVMAAIGVTAGTGYAGAAIGLSIFVRALLSGVWWLESRSLGGMRLLTVEMEFDPDNGKTRVRLERVLADYSLPDPLAKWTPDDAPARLTLRLQLHHRRLRELLDDLVAVPAVKTIREFSREK